MHILIAEDDPVARHTGAFVADARHTVSVTTTLAEARAAFDADFAIEAIISDGMMPTSTTGSVCAGMCGRPKIASRTSSCSRPRTIWRAAAQACRWGGRLPQKPLQRDELELRLIAAERVSGVSEARAASALGRGGAP